MEMRIDTIGNIHAIYSEDIDLAALGSMAIRRASYVEPDDQGQWWADLSPVAGPRLGPYSRRTEALNAELSWLHEHGERWQG